jgi:hypothetical protein
MGQPIGTRIAEELGSSFFCNKLLHGDDRLGSAAGPKQGGTEKGAAPGWKPPQRGERSAFRVGWSDCSGPASTFLTVMRGWEISRHGLIVARGRLENQMFDPIFPPKSNLANERLAKHLMGAPRQPVHVPAPAGAGRHQLAGGVGDRLQPHPAAALGWQPDLSVCAGAVDAKVGMADVLATPAFALDFLSQFLLGMSVVLALPRRTDG